MCLFTRGPNAHGCEVRREERTFKEISRLANAPGDGDALAPYFKGFALMATYPRVASPRLRSCLFSGLTATEKDYNEYAHPAYRKLLLRTDISERAYHTVIRVTFVAIPHIFSPRRIFI